MPRARLLSAALVATVLAVGASLAFREEWFPGANERLPDLAPTKSVARQPAPPVTSTWELGQNRPYRTWGEEKGPLTVSKDLIKRCGEKHKGESAYLIAVAIASRDVFYTQELIQRDGDVLVMSLLGKNDLAWASRARELDPKNAWTILNEAEMRFVRNRQDPEALRIFLLAAEAEGYSTPRETLYAAFARFAKECEMSLEDAWQFCRKADSWIDRPIQEDPFATSLVEHMAELAQKDPDSESSQAIRRTLLHLAGLPGPCDAEYLPGQLSRALRTLGVQEDFRITEWQKAWFSHRMQQELFTLALQSATPQQLADAEACYRKGGVDITRYQLIEDIGREEMNKRLAERNMQREIRFGKDNLPEID